MPHPLDGYRGAVMLVPDHPWPSTTGGRVRSAAIATALRGFGPLTILAIDTPGADPRWVVACRRHRARRASTIRRLRDLSLGIARGNHVALERATAARLPQAFAEVLAEVRPSVVILGRPFVGPFIDVARLASAAVVVEADESLERVNRSILRSHASVSARLRAFLDLLAVGRMERRDYPRADEIWVSSDVEQAQLSRIVGPERLRVVPNVGPDPRADAAEPPEVHAVGFVGYFRHPPNEEAAIELMISIMPAVRALGGPHRLVLIGREPTARMRRLAARDPDTVITGEVPDPVVALREAGVLVVPIRSGAGTRIKVLDAVAAGVPIVSTPYGVEGLSFIDGDDVLTADSVGEIASALTNLAGDAALRRRLVINARRTVGERYSSSVLASVVGASIGCFTDSEGASPTT